LKKKSSLGKVDQRGLEWRRWSRRQITSPFCRENLGQTYKMRKSEKNLNAKLICVFSVWAYFDLWNYSSHPTVGGHSCWCTHLPYKMATATRL